MVSRRPTSEKDSPYTSLQKPRDWLKIKANVRAKQAVQIVWPFPVTQAEIWSLGIIAKVKRQPGVIGKE